MKAKEIFNAMTEDMKKDYDAKKDVLKEKAKALAVIQAKEDATDGEKLQAKSEKNEAQKKVQSVIDAVYLSQLIVNKSAQEVALAYLKDCYRPTISCNVDKKGNVHFELSDTTGMSIYPMMDLVAYLVEQSEVEEGAPEEVVKTAEKIRAIANHLAGAKFDDARQTTAGYAIQKNIDASDCKREDLTVAYMAAGFSLVGMGEQGRNATEKVWQEVIDHLIGKETEKKPRLRVKISMVNDFILFDHIFDRQKNGSIKVCTADDFANRFVHTIHRALTDEGLTIAANK